MSKEENGEIRDLFDIEYFLDRDGYAFKHTRGRSGPQLNVKECPCCFDTRSRVYLNTDSGIGNCFVCNQTFNKSSFVNFRLGYDGMKWKDTYDYMRDVMREQGWRPKKKAVVAVDFGEVKMPISIELPTPEGQSLRYLDDRGVTHDIARYFKLRFCEEGWWNFTKDDGSPGGRKIVNRVIIPVFDLEGNLVTFQGRDVTGAQEPKYWFPPGLPGTGRYLFNGQNAVHAKRVVVGEGAFDVAALKIAVDGEVALRDMVPMGTFGKHLSFGDINGGDQLGAFISLKDAGLEEVVIMWDGEVHALEAALEAAKRLRGIGLVVRIALLPKGKDPNEVSEEICRRAIWEAKVYTAMLHVTWSLRNPYR